MIKQTLRNGLLRLGVYVSRASSIPFGVDAYADIAALEPSVAVAFDVGANRGQTVARMRAHLPNVRIFSFEPVASTFTILKNNVNRDRGVECLQMALGDLKGQAEIAISKVSDRNTLSALAGPDHTTEVISVTTVDDFVAERNLERIDILKMDTEGYESAVLRGAAKSFEANRIGFVLAECEFTPNPAEPHGDFFEILKFLSPFGYRVVAFYSGGVDANGWRWGDVLFARPCAGRPVTCSPFTR